MDFQFLAEILVSSWKLSQGDRPLPTGQGVLDQALRSAVDKGAFPKKFGELRFAQTGVGIRCSELNSILACAQAGGLTANVNPSYMYTQIKISSAAARYLLKYNNINPQTATQWGQKLAVAVQDSLSSEPA